MAVLVVTLLLLRWCLLCFLHLGAAGHHGGVHLGSQKAALLQWKSTLRISPPALDSWRQGTNPCRSNWTGVVCGAVRRGRRSALAVTGISLPNAGIDGHLGALNFSALPFLTYVDLSYNSLHGEIPLSITTLTALSYLDLSDNWLQGHIPSEIGCMGRLSQLGLSSNNLIGCIPTSLGNLTMLVEFALDQNMVTGSIPEELGKIYDLEALQLSNTLLSGQIPESLSNLTKLNTLYLFSNNLSGAIPSSLCNRTNLLDLDLTSNFLSGQIPESLGNLTKLRLQDNQLSGPYRNIWGPCASSKLHPHVDVFC